MPLTTPRTKICPWGRRAHQGWGTRRRGVRKDRSMWEWSHISGCSYCDSHGKPVVPPGTELAANRAEGKHAEEVVEGLHLGGIELKAFAARAPAPYPQHPRQPTRPGLIHPELPFDVRLRRAKKLSCGPIPEQGANATMPPAGSNSPTSPVAARMQSPGQRTRIRAGVLRDRFWIAPSRHFCRRRSRC